MDSDKKNSLLIIDDEKSNLKTLFHILSPEYTIFTAANGTKGIEIARTCSPDLILLDILMPEMDGYQTLYEIKNCEETRKIPVIFITGLDSKEDEEKGLALDAADYITKPFNSQIVKLRVRNQIQIINQLSAIAFLSMHDHLTRMPNRRSFDERLQMEWNQARREHTPISILMADIDKFKNINDTYGHKQGDMVLQAIAGIFPRVLKRPGDFAARWGGEEFAVLLPNTPLHGALEIAGKIRAAVEKKDIHCADGLVVNVTVSIGVNSQMPAKENPIKNNSIELFLSGADNALFTAKSSGRNSVLSHDG